MTIIYWLLPEKTPDAKSSSLHFWYILLSSACFQRLLNHQE